MHKLTLAGLAAAAFLLITACRGDSSPAPTATSTPSATATGTAPTSTVTPSATASPVALPAGVTAAMVAIESGDLARIRALVQFTNQPCTTQLGAGGPPKCASGEVAGTQVEVFQYTSCEPGWVRRPVLDAILGEVFSHPFARYAVYRATTGDIAVFQAKDNPVVGAGVAAVVNSDRISALARTCGAGDTASALIPRSQTTFLLNPPSR
jgi:hypothetical protein